MVDPILGMHKPWKLLRSFDPRLRRLLLSDIFVLAGRCRPSLSSCIAWPSWSKSTAGTPAAADVYTGGLLVVMEVTSLSLYLPVGHFASKPGSVKKPFIGVTFLLFAVFR